MTFLQALHAKARQQLAHIILCEGDDKRVIAAAVEADRLDLARITLIGNKETIAKILGKPLPERIRVIEPNDAELIERCAHKYVELRKAKAPSIDRARELTQHRHVLGTLLVRMGEADGLVGGAITPTADIVRTAIQLVGVEPGTTTVSSCFFMLLDSATTSGSRILTFSDCALVIEPDANQLASIALSAAQCFQRFVGEEPRVAMLSFSSAGSASHASVNKVQQATAQIRDSAPDLLIDGEVQFDAAVVPEVASTKLSLSQLNGSANVLIFPDLNAGNIGYKIAQRLGNAQAIGPILLGLNQPINDLSRGCSTQDIIDMVAITAVQASNP